jgi:hypothetical protein
MNECVIYDFETLSNVPSNGVVTSFALLTFSESRYVSNPYSYDELLDSTRYIKFDVLDQMENYKRKTQQSTIDWWMSQPKEAQKQIKPSSADVSITELHQFILDNVEVKSVKKSYTRGNTFDPIFLDSVLASVGKVSPIHWGSIRDTRSMIEGMAFGMEIDNGFMINEHKDKFVKHNPRHDIVMDVLRMQMLANSILQ